MANKQIKDVTRKTGTPSTTDLVLIDQRQSDGSYVTRSASMSQVVNAVSAVLDLGADDYDSVNLDYTTIPVAYGDVNGTAKAITIKSDGALYATSQAKLDDFYLKYPGYGSYQRITSKYIPGWSSNYHLNLPPGTSFYSTLTSTSIAAYLKIGANQVGSYVEAIPGIYLSKEKGTTGHIRTDEDESGSVTGVYYWFELVKSLSSSTTYNRCYLYARNDSSENAYARVTGTRISRSCSYYKGDTEYGDKLQYKTRTLTKYSSGIITPGSTQYVCYFDVYTIPSTIPYDDTGWFYYDIYLDDYLYVQFYSLQDLR